MPLTVNGIYFKNQNIAKQYVRDIIERNMGDKIYPIDDDYQFLDELIARHPNKNITDHIEWFECVRNINAAPALNYCVNGAVDDISWIKCVTKREDKPKDLLIECLRTAVKNQTQGYKDVNFNIGDACKICGKVLNSTRAAQVDHKTISFKEIKEEFISQTELTVPTRFYDEGGHWPAKFTHQDREFENAWSAFHALKADYQILCAQCNIRK